MSYVIAAPDAASTSRVIAAGGDEVSAAIASLFSGDAKAFQALSAQAVQRFRRPRNPPKTSRSPSCSPT